MNTPKIPHTDSIAELARFWDTHDLTDFEDELEEVPESVFERRAEETVTLHYHPSVMPVGIRQTILATLPATRCYHGQAAEMGWEEPWAVKSGGSLSIRRWVGKFPHSVQRSF